MIGWFVIYTKPRQESVAQENLLRQGFETYLPWLRRPRRLRNRRVEASEPLFTRYLFVRLDPDERSVAPIRSTTGVTSLVGFGNQLLPVPDAVIHQLRSAEGPDGHVHPPQERPFVPGDIVRIDAGPFEHLTGVFLERRGRERARILLEVLGKASAISVPRYHLVAA
jgi:transcriptional antiterminator RfaH